MAISYKQMCAFITVADSGTFSEAADKLCMSQPALSSAIKTMESTAGGKLFIRSTRRVTLSPEGQHFYPIARRLVSEWEFALDDLNSMFSLQSGLLKIAAMPSFASDKLADILYSFHQTAPNVMIKVQDVVMESVIGLVESEQVELGFIFEPEPLSSIEFIDLFTDRFVMVMSAQHPLAKRTSVTFDELQGQSYITMNQGSSIRRWTEEAFLQHGISVRKVIETSQFATLANLVAANIGVSIVPSLCITQMASKGCVCKEISDVSIQKRVGLIKRSKKDLSTAAQHLVKQLVAPV